MVRGLGIWPVNTLPATAKLVVVKVLFPNPSRFEPTGPTIRMKLFPVGLPVTGPGTLKSPMKVSPVANVRGYTGATDCRISHGPRSPVRGPVGKGVSPRSLVRLIDLMPGVATLIVSVPNGWVIV